MILSPNMSTLVLPTTLSSLSMHTLLGMESRVKRCLKGGKKRECEESGVARGDWRQRWLTYLIDAGTNEEEMREREQMSLKAGEVLIVTELEEEDCCEDPGDETRLVGMEIKGMRGMTLKEPRASLEVKYMLLDLLNLEEVEQQNVLKLLDVKVQEDKIGRNVGGKRTKVVMKMEGKSDLLKKIWKGMRGPVKEYGGTMSFIQESEASTPAKERSKGRGQRSRLEEARERARHEVEGLLSGEREQELEQDLQKLGDKAAQLEEEMKQLNHNEAMGREVLEETQREIQRGKARLEKLSNLWREAEARLTDNEDNQELRKEEQKMK